MIAKECEDGTGAIIIMGARLQVPSGASALPICLDDFDDFEGLKPANGPWPN